ncbi:hypothetical protein [Kitasatospora sp. NPDC047058]|uniref:hypothetical protein n=1 Tax=Kitasatospora sp. NPDC047058 TaxID=3155620 RepID=UPI0033EDC4D5
MGFVLPDPTAARWVPDEQAVLAVVTVGEDGHRFLVNAAAKAAGHRRLGRNHGEASWSTPTCAAAARSATGTPPRSAARSSGRAPSPPDQDLHEAGRLAADLVNAVAEHHLAWEERVGPGDWYATTDEPHPSWRAMVAFATPAATR